MTEERQKIDCIAVCLIELIDMDFGFIPENRKYRQTCLLGPQGKDKVITDQIYTLFPLRFFSSSTNYFEAHTDHFRELAEIADGSWIPYAIQRKPKENICEEAALNYLTKGTPVVDNKDEDSPFFQYTESYKYVDLETRREYFRNEPFLFGQEVILQRYGCEHYARNCSIFCPHCNQEFSCEKCHNEAKKDECKVLTSSEVERIRCFHCEQEQQVDLTCNASGSITQPYKCECCDEIISTMFCPVCREFTLQQMEFRPMFHCNIHNECHQRMTEKKHFYCSDCNICLSLADSVKHVCYKNLECCICFGGFEKADDCQLVCKHRNHLIHEECERYMTDRFHCPICRLVVPGYVHHRNNLLFVFDWFVALQKTVDYNFYQFVCPDCGTYFYDIEIGLCPKCFITHKRRIEPVCQMTKDSFVQLCFLFKFGADNDENQLLVQQYIENGVSEFFERVVKYDSVMQLIGIFDYQ